MIEKTRRGAKVRLLLDSYFYDLQFNRRFNTECQKGGVMHLWRCEWLCFGCSSTTMSFLLHVCLKTYLRIKVPKLGDVYLLRLDR